jgi:hypothetical protein
MYYAETQRSDMREERVREGERREREPMQGEEGEKLS